MVKMEDEFSCQISANDEHAQMLIKLEPRLGTYGEAKEIIDAEGIGIIEERYLLPELVLFVLDVKDMRNLALKLTENGFVVKGVNASCSNGYSS
jgi:hypothetical protein